MNKSEIKMNLRREKLAARATLTPAEVKNKSAEICTLLSNDERVRAAKCVLTYLPYGNEVSLLALNDFFWQRGARLLVPVCSKTEIGIMQAADFTPADLANLTKSTLGVLEPNAADFADPKDIDLVLVPGVVFDRRGGRMGHGKGFYDRYLPLLKPEACAIGIGYEVQLAERLITEPWDYPLDALCTEKGLWHF